MSKIRGSSFPGPRPSPAKPSIAKGDIRKNPADGHGKTLDTFKKSLHAELGR